MEKGMVVTWVKKEGDTIKEGEHIVTIMTEKVEFEVSAPSSGILHKILADEGIEMPVGEAIALIIEPGEVPPPPPSQEVAEEARMEFKISPAARKLADEHRIDISKISGTGPEGRIVRDDVLHVIEEAKKAGVGGFKSVSLSPLRVMTAQRMLQSHQTIPPVTLTLSVDAKQLIKVKDELNISYDAIFVEVLAKALREQEVFNATLVESELRIPYEVNIGVAVSTDDGLIVPVIQNADKKTLQEISQEINSLMTKARTSQLTVKDISKGTFTLSNLGMFGVETFTPIITPGQTAVLGVGSIMKRAVVEGEGITVKPQVSLSLTFDHRVVDGAIAAKFLSRLRQIIEAGSFTE